MASETQASQNMIVTSGSRRVSEASSDALFYAYAQQTEDTFTLTSLPSIVAFATAAIADEWWELVKKEYPGSERLGPQLFTLNGYDMPGEIQNNLKFYHLRNKWFLMTDGTEGSTGVIPLQDWKGNPVTTGPSAPAPVPRSPEQKTKEEPTWDMAKLSATLEKMNSMISENSAQIHALSVAQSEGLQRMQEINQTNSTQIKALAENQTKLQWMIDHSASHCYIALSNSSSSRQEQLKSALRTNAEQIHALAESQTKMAATCSTILNGIEDLGRTVARVAESGASRRGWSAGEVGQLPHVPPFIAPAPRKLNRRIKSVWYEYDRSLDESHMSSVDC